MTRDFCFNLIILTTVQHKLIAIRIQRFLFNPSKIDFSLLIYLGEGVLFFFFSFWFKQLQKRVTKVHRTIIYAVTYIYVETHNKIGVIKLSSGITAH